MRRDGLQLRNVSLRRYGASVSLTVLLAAASFAFELTHGAPRPILTADSGSYINFWAIRTGGYPGFLAILRSLGASLSLVVLVQAAIAHVCSTYLAVQICRSTPLPELGVIALVAMVAPPPIREFWRTIGTEALFVPLVALFTAELIRFARTKSASALATLCATLVVATAVRPAGLPLFSSVAVLLLWGRRDLNRRHYVALAMSALFALGVVWLESAYYGMRHSDGQPRESLLGIMLFGRSALISLDDEQRQEARQEFEERELRLFEAVDRDFAPVRQLLDRVDSAELLEHLTSGYGAFAEYRYLRLNGYQKAPSPGEAARLDTAFLRKVGLSRISQAPGQYVRLSLINYIGLWSPWSVKTPDGVSSYHELVQANGGLPFAEQIPVVGKHGSRGLYYGRQLFRAFGLITFCLGLFTAFASLLCRPRDPTLFTVGLLSLTVHAYTIVLALTAIGIQRYTLALWPIFVSIVILSMSWFVASVAQTSLSRTVVGATNGVSES